MEKPLFKTLSALLGLMFLAFAALQFNDPDPYLWVPIYLLPAGLCMGSMYRPLPHLAMMALAVAAVAGAVMLWPAEFKGLTGKMDSRPEVELARESLGLGIVALGFLFLAWRGKARQGK